MTSSIVMTVFTTAVATLALLMFLRFALWPRHPKILRSPLRTVIPSLSADALAELDYAPDAFPGARDVPTPYGSIRVYEWGPTAGPKVLLIHGISTTCQTLGPIARALAASHGCRVMLFDLFGRGFSDAPTDLPHDARLYVSQALLALASSPLPWTGAQARLRVVGYSMGGGVAIHLVAALPRGAVESLALLAPAGLIRPQKFGLATRLVFTAGLVPERLLAALTRRRLQRPIAAGVKRKPGGSGAVTPASSAGATTPLLATAAAAGTDGAGLGAAVGAALAEAGADGGARTSPKTPLERRVLRYVQWMVAHHPGFVPAFMSCIRHAPLMGQQAAYAALRSEGVKTALILGSADEIVDAGDYEEDALPLLGGKEAVFWRVVAGGDHAFPMTEAKETVRALVEFWGTE